MVGREGGEDNHDTKPTPQPVITTHNNKEERKDNINDNPSRTSSPIHDEHTFSIIYTKSAPQDANTTTRDASPLPHHESTLHQQQDAAISLLYFTPHNNIHKQQNDLIQASMSEDETVNKKSSMPSGSGTIPTNQLDKEAQSCSLNTHGLDEYCFGHQYSSGHQQQQHEHVALRNGEESQQEEFTDDISDSNDAQYEVLNLHHIQQARHSIPRINISLMSNNNHQCHHQAQHQSPCISPLSCHSANSWTSNPEQQQQQHTYESNNNNNNNYSTSIHGQYASTNVVGSSSSSYQNTTPSSSPHHFPTTRKASNSISSSNSNSSLTQFLPNSYTFHTSSRSGSGSSTTHHELLSNIDQVIVGNKQKRKDSFILFYEQDQSLTDHSILEPIVIRTSSATNNSSPYESTSSVGSGSHISSLGDSQHPPQQQQQQLKRTSSSSQVDSSDVSSTCESLILTNQEANEASEHMEEEKSYPASYYWKTLTGGFIKFFMSSLLNNHEVSTYLQSINTATKTSVEENSTSTVSTPDSSPSSSLPLPQDRRSSLSDDEALIIKFKSRHEQLAKANPKLMIAIAILLIYVSLVFINPVTHGYFVFWLGFVVEMSFNITIDTLCSTVTIKSIPKLELINICRTLIAIMGRIVVQTYYGPNFPFWILQTFPIIISVNIFYYRRIFSLINTATATFGCCLSIYISYIWEYDARGKMDEYILEEMKTKILEIIGLHFILTVGTYMFSRIMEQQSDDNARKQLELLKQQIVNTAKTKFIGNLSHEARNPLQGILCSIQLLKHETVNSEKSQIFNSQSFRETLDDIYYNSNLLLHIFSTSLQLTNLELGKIKLNEMKINLVDILESMIAVFIRNAEEKRISIGSFYNFKSLPKYMFLGDQSRVCQILMNILSNAVKYTDKGHVLLTAEQCTNKDLLRVGLKKYPEYTYVKFICKDTGCGISEAKTKDLFKKPFYKVDQETFNSTIQNSSNPIFEQYYKKSLTNNDIAIEDEERDFKENNGYGLSISKSLLDLMGGRIFIESKVDEYTKVTIIIPLKNLVGDYSGFDDYSSEFFESNQRTIEVLSKELHESIHHCTPEFYLLDKHNTLTGSVIKPYLQFLFPNSNVFESDLEAISKNADKTKYNIVLYNANTVEDFSNIPCLAIPISARGQFNDKRYISSPVRFRELVDVLLHYIKLFPCETSIIPPSSSNLFLTPTNILEKSIEPPQKKALVVEDNDINRKVIIKLLKLIGYENVDSCENGLDSVEKCKQSKYEIILMDLLMPIMNGKDASVQIRQGQNSKTPIIGITANIWETYETLKEFGFDSVLYKPIMLNKLKNEIEKVLQHSLTHP